MATIPSQQAVRTWAQKNDVTNLSSLTEAKIARAAAELQVPLSAVRPLFETAFAAANAKPALETPPLPSEVPVPQALVYGATPSSGARWAPIPAEALEYLGLVAARDSQVAKPFNGEVREAGAMPGKLPLEKGGALAAEVGHLYRTPSAEWPPLETVAARLLEQHPQLRSGRDIQLTLAAHRAVATLVERQPADVQGKATSAALELAQLVGPGNEAGVKLEGLVKGLTPEVFLLAARAARSEGVEVLKLSSARSRNAPATQAMLKQLDAVVDQVLRQKGPPLDGPAKKHVVAAVTASLHELLSSALQLGA